MSEALPQTQFPRSPAQRSIQIVSIRSSTSCRSFYVPAGNPGWSIGMMIMFKTEKETQYGSMVAQNKTISYQPSCWQMSHPSMTITFSHRPFSLRTGTSIGGSSWTCDCNVERAVRRGNKHGASIDGLGCSIRDWYRRYFLLQGRSRPRRYV